MACQDTNFYSAVSNFPFSSCTPYCRRAIVLFHTDIWRRNVQYYNFFPAETISQKQNCDTRQLAPTRCWLEMRSNVVRHESRIQPARIEPLIIPCHTAQYFLEYTTESCKEKIPRPWVLITPAQSGVYPEKRVSLYGVSLYGHEILILISNSYL